MQRRAKRHNQSMPYIDWNSSNPHRFSVVFSLLLFLLWHLIPIFHVLGLNGATSNPPGHAEVSSRSSTSIANPAPMQPPTSQLQWGISQSPGMTATRCGIIQKMRFRGGLRMRRGSVLCSTRVCINATVRAWISDSTFLCRIYEELLVNRML
ncbi:hypothetical protein ASPVEDRAFT_741127 [Aspergillus versicolor CBS 583.65]|uniref:Uncharacterized protein n=1 Tax=Aspergillus versicolor CBS 583.65 TaxID=1036611 RepID=A0A1L9PQ67_ASPVE|nr:uncharacterized protein ASPVEDRAFT_741127 [Aspergillus versicolor CBS 583.65]OJJ03596.1 hypothetical protein ASPVEDRAFT_741127 [Aspergillus versicolor CBS 583.65]